MVSPCPPDERAARVTDRVETKNVVPSPRADQPCTPGNPCHGICEFCNPREWMLEQHDQAAQLLDTYPTASPVPAGWADIARNNMQERRVEPSTEPPPYLDWSEFLSQDFSSVEFLPGDLLRVGGHGALVGEGKAGKSLFALEWAQAIGAGRSFLGSGPRAPRRVLYIDFENGWPDIQQRVEALGYTAADLAGVRYLSFPPMPPLNTEEGGAYLLDRVRDSRAEVVFLDTISRMVVGKENDADPWRDLYNCSLLRLKADGVSSIRLDHFGKDVAKGARGSSAKTQDVDAVWELSSAGRKTAAGVPIKLQRTHTRNGLGNERLDMWRTGRIVKHGDSEKWAPGETGHLLREGSGDEDQEFIVAEHLAALADQVGVLKTAGRDALRAALPDQRHAKSVWEEAARIRKSR